MLPFDNRISYQWKYSKPYKNSTNSTRPIKAKINIHQIYNKQIYKFNSFTLFQKSKLLNLKVKAKR